MSEGAAVANVASKAGSGWANHLAPIQDLLATPRLERRTVGDGQPRRAGRPVLLLEGVRRRVHDAARARSARARDPRELLSPGPVESPMMPSFREALGSSLLDWTAEQVGRMGRPDEMAGRSCS